MSFQYSRLLKLKGVLVLVVVILNCILQSVDAFGAGPYKYQPGTTNANLILPLSSQPFVISEPGETISLHEVSDVDILGEQDEFPPPQPWRYIEMRNAPGILKETWRTSRLGDWLGVNGLYTIDLEEDGIDEILIAGKSGHFNLSNSFNVLKYDPLTEGYEVAWSSGYTGTDFHHIFPFVRESDGHLLVNIAFRNGAQIILDLTINEYLTYWRTYNFLTFSPLYGDIDNDGKKELIVSGGDSLHVYDVDTFEKEQLLYYGYKHGAIGNVDTDPAIEYITGNGQVLEIHGEDVTVQWEVPTVLDGFMIHLSDIDNDGIEELIYQPGNNYLLAYDVDTESLKWSYQSEGHIIERVYLYDWGADEEMDIIYGETFNGVTCINATNLDFNWYIFNPNTGVGGITVADADGDGEDEVFWTAGFYTTEPDHLLAYNLTDISLEFQSLQTDQPYRAVEVGDLDGDGDNEIVTVSSSSNGTLRGDGILEVFDVASHDVVYKGGSLDFGGYSTLDEKDLAIADVDNDGQAEILVTMDYWGDPKIYQLDGVTFEVEREYTYPGGGGDPSGAVTTADLDGDGLHEIIGHFGVTNISQAIQVFGHTGDLILNATVEGSDLMHSIKVDDIDLDGSLDIVYVGSEVGILNWQTGHSELVPISIGARCFDIYQVDDDPQLELVVGTYRGLVRVYDGISLELEHEYRVDDDFAIKAIEVEDLNQDGLFEFVLSIDPRTLSVYNPRHEEIIWAFPTSMIGTNANSLVVEDIDGDGVIEILAGSSESLFEFKYDDTYPPELPVYSHVYPGDTDNNGMVDEYDILPVVMFFLEEGPPRTDRSLGWWPQNILPWQNTPAEYADATGDGIISESDIIPIALNWYQSHNSSYKSFEIEPDETFIEQHRTKLARLYESVSSTSGEAGTQLKQWLGELLQDSMPLSFRVYPNYPNPFNSHTSIQFEIDGSRRTSVHIYDIRGVLIQIVCENELLDVGTHRFDLELGEFPSGTYFCQIEYGESSEVIKMMMVK